jgi:hypothetical protein
VAGGQIAHRKLQIKIRRFSSLPQHPIIGAAPVGLNGRSRDFNFDFFVLAADANRDRRVDINDLSILAMNWQGAGKVFSQGDFNYDGKVDAKDLGILSTRWQSVLTPPVAATPAGAGRTPTRTATRVAKRVL